MARVKVKLLKPLDGAAIGSIAEYDERDAKYLAKRTAVHILGPVKAAKRPANKMAQPPANKSTG